MLTYTYKEIPTDAVAITVATVVARAFRINPKTILQHQPTTANETTACHFTALLLLRFFHRESNEVAAALHMRRTSLCPINANFFVSLERARFGEALLTSLLHQAKEELYKIFKEGKPANG